MKTIKEDWNSMALAYEEFNNSPDSYSYNIEWPVIQKMLPRIEGKRVLDIGCGTGIFTFLLEECGPCEIVGLDLSDSMLEIAREKAAQKGSEATFVLGDATNANKYVEGKFDLIFSSTTSHYIKDLKMFFENVQKCLAEDGCMILSIIHPVYSAMYPIEHGDRFPEDDEWQVRYLDKAKRAYIQPWIEYNDEYENQLSKSYHYTFSDYMNAIINAGLKVLQVEEPMPPQSWKTDCPGRYEGYLETPVYMILKLENN